MLLAGVGCLAPTPVRAQLVVSANDGEQVLVDGVQVAPTDPVPDSVTVIDLGRRPLRVIATAAAPTSVIGPPGSVAVSPDERFALVTSSRKIDPADRTRLIPDDRISVIDLRSRPLRVVATYRAGAGASGVALNPAGTLALVANRSEGSVSVFGVRAGVLTVLGKVELGDPQSSPATPIFSADGRQALVTRDGDHRISVLNIDGAQVTLEPRAMLAGPRPYGADTDGPRDFAVVAAIGGGGADVDTVSLIDWRTKAPHIVDVVAVGRTPEGLKMSPDGRHVAVAVNNGSNNRPDSPFFSRRGLLQVWRIQDARLVKVAETATGRWSQGVVWSSDSRVILLQSMVEKEIEVFAFDGSRLRREAAIALPAGPAGLGVAAPLRPAADQSATPKPLPASTRTGDRR